MDSCGLLSAACAVLSSVMCGRREGVLLEHRVWVVLGNRMVARGLPRARDSVTLLHQPVLAQKLAVLLLVYHLYCRRRCWLIRRRARPWARRARKGRGPTTRYVVQLCYLSRTSTNVFARCLMACCLCCVAYASWGVCVCGCCVASRWHWVGSDSCW